ncbi:tannase/feruloyl esterase family alpha/beta hydrolase [Nocardia sp. CDC159]|uniref:Tannase/feruloyl esterase family alpha/beta hydrolase n=1 Tax=Nocardia pulmonis TaxID=2951408 RepID=A0A9X2EGX9_9NOCA|nr:MULTISPECIES: tannase/feruloyl esterase family alpha/beta hydrolase [Nocardia]MCM6778096.1 tannase/feruloyl esterase family alpha/beta hydrolase [Nocardia pulmonis]MCM6790985.1 tannase/feruloyl esterase family alpha/beta hydrolase [Nocardia sp. CDC159]
MRIATIALVCAWVGTAPAHASALEAPCAAPPVPGAQLQLTACLDDLTTAGTVSSGHTNPAHWAGLTSAGAHTPRGVPGRQIDGYFPDDSTTNTEHGWNHDSQFVVRLPDRWNGGLVVAGTPGNRRQYANDITISDWVLASGYAYAATDKGNTGSDFHRDGVRPGDAVAEWHSRVTQLTVAAAATVTASYGRPPAHTYLAGVSNGGYLVRWQLENMPWLYDGGVDWEGTLWTADGPNPLTFLPPAIRNFPRAATDPAAFDAMLAAGFAPGSEPLWDYHDRTYWGSTQRIHRQEFDPEYTGDEAEYDYSARPRAVREAVRRIALTGRIERPLITIHGTLDALLPIGPGSDTYGRMIGAQGRAGLHRYYRIADGNHVDGLYDTHPGLLRPMLPCFRSAFAALEIWSTAGQSPPPSVDVPRPGGGDIVGSCALGG